MTETVILALQGRVVQLGTRTPTVLLTISRFNVAPWLVLERLGTETQRVELYGDGLTDLRDILNALAGCRACPSWLPKLHACGKPVLSGVGGGASLFLQTGSHRHGFVYTHLNVRSQW